MSIENLKNNKIFKYKTLELIYTINKFQIEKSTWTNYDFENILNSNLHPTELNTLMFLLKSFKELYENIDPNIFKNNQKIFFFAHKFRNVNWHKDSYISNVKDIINSDTFKEIINSSDIKNIELIVENIKLEGKKLLNFGLIFQRRTNSKLVLVIIVDNNEYTYNVKEEFLLYIFSIFNESLMSIYNYLFKK